MKMCSVALGVALCGALLAAPTAGAGTLASPFGSFSFCEPVATTAFVGRGGNVREPDLGTVATDLPAAAKGRAGKNFKATIPVYVHVVTDGAIGNLTDQQIADQIAVLNRTFAGGEGGAVTRFSFRLAGVTRTDNADWFYAGPGGNAEHSMKRALQQGGDDALNFYSTTAGDYLGWAYLPDIVDKARSGVPRRRRHRLGVDPGHVHDLCGPLRRGRDRHARGRPLARPRAHVLRRLQRQGRLRRRHASRAHADVGLSRGQGHVPGARTGPDPQLHGLLLRQLLHGVHGRPDAADAGRLAALPRSIAAHPSELTSGCSAVRRRARSTSACGQIPRSAPPAPSPWRGWPRARPPARSRPPWDRRTTASTRTARSTCGPTRATRSPSPTRPTTRIPRRSPASRAAPRGPAPAGPRGSLLSRLWRSRCD